MSVEDVRQRIPERWGQWIQVGPGWYGLVSQLDQALASIDPDYEVHQVKSKFGGLRYYFGTTKEGEEWQRMHDLANEAARRSRDICERCGGLGSLIDDDGWYRVACESCAPLDSTIPV